ncbi:MAG TPA: hypothetical protein VGF55_18010 [Gemmataceae bacterium]|jgi:hypothetical protein
MADFDPPGCPAPRPRWWVVAALLLLPPAAEAQQANVQVHYTRQPEINVPFVYDGAVRIKQVQLYVSTDSARDWRQAAAAPYGATRFPPYVFGADGTYWFAVRTLDLQDRHNPEALTQLQPLLKVVVDRRPPVVSLRQIADSRPGIVSVEWDVRDENFDPRRFVLEYRVTGTDWQREAAAEARPSGVQSWRLDAGVRMDVRIRAADRAGNEAEQMIPVGFTADGRPFDSSTTSGNSTAQTGASVGVFYSKSTKISLGYRIDRVPQSGMTFDLWYTQDKGRTWTKVPKTGDATAGGTAALPASPGGGGTEAAVGKLIFDATAQGEYGFLIVARNGVGIGDPDPRPGDPPRYRVVVDTESPHVQVKVQRGQGYDVRNVRIEWAADDPNLADRPVTVEYAEVKGDAPPADADWKPIPADGLSGRLDRSGVQVWTVGKNGPFKFLIRAKAEDKAGNVAVDQWREPVLVDLEHPSVNITGIEPAR